MRLKGKSGLLAAKQYFVWPMMIRFICNAVLVLALVAMAAIADAQSAANDSARFSMQDACWINNEPATFELFNDYASCLYGFRTPDGTVVVPAKYTSAAVCYGLTKVQGDSFAPFRKFYLVEKDGKKGLIDADLNEVLPVTFGNIRLQTWNSCDICTPNVFAVLESGTKKQLYHFPSGTISTASYDSIIHPTYSCFNAASAVPQQTAICKKGKRWLMTDSLGQPFLKLSKKLVFGQWLDDQRSLVSSAKNPKETAVINRQGKLVVPFTTDHIARTSYNNDPPTFWCLPPRYDTLHTYNVYNTNGELVLSQLASSGPFKCEIDWSRPQCVSEVTVLGLDSVFGAFSYDGTQMLPMEYNTIKYQLNSGPRHSPTLITSRDGKLYGMFTATGDTLMPAVFSRLQHYSHPSNIAMAEYLGNTPLDSLAKQLLTYTYERDWLDGHRIYALRNDTLYFRKRNVFQRCTIPATHPHPTKVWEHQYLTDAHGKLLRKQGLSTVRNCHVYRVGHKLQVFSLEDGHLIFETEEGDQIQGRGMLEILKANGRVGLWSYDSLKYIIPPTNYALWASDYYWVKKTPMSHPDSCFHSEGGWYIAGDNGTVENELPFDFPISFSYLPETVFRSNGKYGTCKSDGSVVLQPTYDNVVVTRQRLGVGEKRIQKNGLWGYITGNGTIAEPKWWRWFEARYGHYALTNTDGVIRIGRMDQDLKMVQRPTVPDSLIWGDRLYGFSTGRGYRGQLASTLPQEFGGQLPTRGFISGYGAGLHQPQMEILNFRVVRELLYKAKHLESERHDPVFHEGFAAPAKLPWCHLPRALQHRRKVPALEVFLLYADSNIFTIEDTYDNNTSAFFSFQHTNNTIRPLHLDSLFLPQSGYRDTLRAVLTKRITEQQLFYGNCPNLSEMIDELLHHFVIMPTHLVFPVVAAAHHEIPAISIPFTELEHMARPNTIITGYK